jgi:hypothetical protein
MRRLLGTRRPISALVPLLALALVTTSCDSGDPPPEPTTISASPSTVISGTVGQAVSVSVTILDQEGQPYAGAQVSFSVTSGGGTVSPTSVNTDQSGRASATWTLGQTAGQQGLSATSVSLSTSFTADAAPGLPASIQSLTTYPGTFDPGEELTQPATFQVEDQFGNHVPGATVSFQASHDGTADPSQTTSDTQGQASTTWTLGPGNAVQTLTATVGSASPATVQAESFDPCLEVAAFSIGNQVIGNLSSESCQDQVGQEIWFLDRYTFSLVGATAVHLTLDAAFQDLRLYLNDAGFIYGIRDDDGTIVSFRAFLDVTTPGWGSASGSGKQYLVRVASAKGGVGNYTLGGVIADGQMDNCDRWISTKSLSTSQNLASTDCELVADPDTWYSDWIGIYLDQGQGIELSQTSTQIDAWIGVTDGEGNWLAVDDNSGTGANARLEFTAESSGFYYIFPSSAVAFQEGAYSLTISPLASGAPPLLAAPRDEPLQVVPFPSDQGGPPLPYRPDAARRNSEAGGR